jgi:hypothetical protein
MQYPANSRGIEGFPDEKNPCLSGKSWKEIKDSQVCLQHTSVIAAAASFRI